MRLTTMTNVTEQNDLVREASHKKLSLSSFSSRITRKMLSSRVMNLSRVGATRFGAIRFASGRSAAAALNAPLTETDPELSSIMEFEKARQRSSLNLIASENYTSQSVFDALGSMMSNKYVASKDTTTRW